VGGKGPEKERSKKDAEGTNGMTDRGNRETKREEIRKE
jgi:hypothetical protein